MKNIGETFINYFLLKDMDNAEEDGIIPNGFHTEEEERHISELDRRMSALDPRETYVTVNALIKSNRKTFVRTLEYLNKKDKEGEEQHE